MPKCKICGQYYRKKEGLNFHMELFHENKDKPICDCIHWGENIYPYFDDGCHLGYSFCNPEKCDDYIPLQTK